MVEDEEEEDGEKTNIFPWKVINENIYFLLTSNDSPFNFIKPHNL